MLNDGTPYLINLECLRKPLHTLFLQMVEESLNREDAPIMALFRRRRPTFRRANHSNLLWALETLAWSPQYLYFSV